MLPPRVILATTDFSAGSKSAVEAAAALAALSGAALHVLYVEETVLSEAARQEGIDLAQETLRELEQFVEAAVQAEVTTHLHVVSGKPIEVIADAAGTRDADLIVMGSHGRTGVGRVVFGSVAEGVLRKSTRPVLVVPSAAQ